MGDIRVRRGRRKDSADFLRLVDALAKYEHLEPPTKSGRRRLLEDIFSKDRIRLLVAVKKKDLVGYALYFFSYSSFLAKPTLYIEDIFVLESQRGRGVGLGLFKRCAKEAAKEDCGRMEWAVLNWNKSAMTFYERIGAKKLADWSVYRLDGDGILRVSRG